MKFNYHRTHSYYLTLSLSLGALTTLLSPSGIAAEPAANTANETKHIHVPFVHIDIKKHADGTKDVDVRAPFTNVHNPAGTDNAQVKAPFYKSDKQPNSAVSTANQPVNK